MAKSIVVIDFSWAGHIPTYHKLWVKALVDLGYRVFSFSPDPAEVIGSLPKESADMLVASPSLTLGKRGHSSHQRYSLLSFLSLKGLSRVYPYKVLASLYYWKRAGALVRSLGLKGDSSVSRVLFPYLDHKLMSTYLPVGLVDYIFPYYWSGLFVSPSEFRDPLPINPNLCGRLNLLKSRNLVSLGILDEGIQSQITSLLDPKPVVWFPDITEPNIHPLDLPAIRELKDRAAGRKIVLLIGELSKAKGVLNFLSLVNVAQNTPFFFALVGPLDSKSCSTLEQREVLGILSSMDMPSNLFIHLGRINGQNAYDAWVNASDYLYAFYPNYYHSSNTLTKACLYSKPALVNSKGLLKQRCLKYDLGLPTSSFPYAQLEDLYLLDRLHVRSSFHTNAAKSYASLHGFETLKASLHALLN
jgi:hypothetical protein